ncbi:hypothetical protein NKL07_21785 [Mesorhizobium sp. C280B]|uniref:hypothetical protein n=1 Tax=unclassified Mesorhizobium TaxID=325217 RepID=UPI0003CDFD5C|nr:hypothetical protein [Mesorhizobium sp. LSJC280B00]ESW92917.1 hypothetical protein X772_02860 [Mesorhizobium sp. LSJC280B00]
MTEIHERLDFCGLEIERFAREVMAYANHGFKSRMADFPSSPSPVKHIYATMVKPIPIALRCRAGMIANEIRACLDALACVLAARNGQDTKGVYFPVKENAAEFAKDGRNKIKKLSGIDQGVIASVQPYQPGNSGILYLLHEADIFRKHIKLVMSGGGAGGIGFGSGGAAFMGSTNTAPPLFTEMKKEFKVHEVIVSGQAEFSIIFCVRFAEPPFNNLNVQFFLEDSLSEVRRVGSLFDTMGKSV